MGCGCKQNRTVRSSEAQVVLTPTRNRTLVPTNNVSAPAPQLVAQTQPTSIDNDRLRIERLRREAIRRSLGR